MKGKCLTIFDRSSVEFLLSISRWFPGTTTYLRLYEKIMKSAMSGYKLSLTIDAKIEETENHVREPLAVKNWKRMREHIHTDF